MLLSYVKPSRPHKAYAYTVPLATKQGDNKHEGKRCRNTPPEGDIFPRLLVPRRRHLRLSHTAPVAESCRTGESPQKPRPAGAPPAGSTQRQPRAHHWNVGIFTPAVATPTSTLSERRLQWGLTSGVAFITRPSGNIGRARHCKIKMGVVANQCSLQTERPRGEGQRGSRKLPARPRTGGAGTVRKLAEEAITPPLPGKADWLDRGCALRNTARAKKIHKKGSHECRDSHRVHATYTAHLLLRVLDTSSAHRCDKM